MKCSLLTLSTFIDGELAPQRRAEVDAHLIGCSRCSAGAATLREEKTRVGQLARVTVDPASAQLMLEQVGIAIEPGVAPLPAAPPAPAPPEDDRRPWQRGTSSPALPWTPRRPERVPAASSDEIVAAPVPDGQPDLPLEGLRAAPSSWNRSPAPPQDAPDDDVAQLATMSDSAAAEPTDWAGTDAERQGNASVPESWEADLPPPAEPTPQHLTAWSASTPPRPIEPSVPPAASPAEPALPATPPTRLASASGPGALWSRIHDAVSVRLALARSGDALDDSVQIVSGVPARRGAQLPEQTPASAPGHAPSTSGIVAASPAPQAAPTMPPPTVPPPTVELHGLGEVEIPTQTVVPAPAMAPPAVDEPRTDPAEAAGWNAFAASSYPEVDTMPAEQPAADRRRRPLGRHSRAVARDNVPLTARMGRLVATTGTALAAAAATATARSRQAVGRVGKSGPDNRLLAGVAAIGLIFVVALLIGHRTSSPAAPVASRPAATAQPQPQQPKQQQSAPAQTSAAAATSGAPAGATVQAFGAGDTGFQVLRLRYGAQTSYMRVVFDLGAAGGGVTGTPKVTVAFPNPTTMLVTFAGTLPAGSTGSPAPGKLISSVSLASSGGGKAVYRFTLTRAATATAFYLASPTRFVLDVH